MSLLMTTEFYLEIQKGNVPGHSIVQKFGQNPDIDGAFEAIWNGGGLYTGFDAVAEDTAEFLSTDGADAGGEVSSGTATSGSATTLVDTGADFVGDGVLVGDIILNDLAMMHGIVSEVTDLNTLTVLMWQNISHAQHDAGVVGPVVDDVYRVATPDGTGASVVHADLGLDGNYAETEEYVIMNGEAVVTGEPILRCSRVRVILAGSGGANAGEIIVRAEGDNAIKWVGLPIGYNRTTIGAFTVPAGKEAYIVHWWAGLNKKQTAASNIRLMMAPVGQPLQVIEEASIDSTGTSDRERPFQIPKNTLPARSDIVVHADSSVGDNSVACGFDIVLIDV